MGYGTWTTAAYSTYASATGRTTTTNSCGTVILNTAYTAQDLFASKRLDEKLNPKGIIRECLDSEEHPNTLPVILALDVTGSMGTAAAEVAKKLNEIMTNLYDKVTDVEFLIMGIGDLSYDVAPIQASQFESDIRIAEQLDKIYFEAGGGGNSFESYTAAWYFGLRHTSLDCWKRGKKGIIITMGDEPLNPYLPELELSLVTGDSVQDDIETESLYKEVTEKFDVYHLAVKDPATCYRMYEDRIKSTFGKYLDEDHLKVVTLNNIASIVSDIIINAADKTNDSVVTNTSEISW